MKQRIITGTVGIIVFLAFLLLGGYWFALFISAIAILAYYELMRMSHLPVFSIPAALGLFFLLLLLYVSIPIYHQLYSPPVFLNMQWMILAFMTVFLMLLIFTPKRFSPEHFSSLMIAIFYTGLAFSFFVQAREVHGLGFVLFILIIVWVTDSGAYFTGKRFGRIHLIPDISPNKTVEGFLGGVVYATVAAIIFYFLSSLFISFWEAVIMAMFISIAGQIGDLIESALKRYYQVKDSGNLLPGHGGILDRFDSLLFVFIVLAIFQYI